MPCVACGKDTDRVAVRSPALLIEYMQALQLVLPATLTNLDFLCQSCSRKARRSTCVKCGEIGIIAVTSKAVVTNIMNDAAYVHKRQDIICKKCYNAHHMAGHRSKQCVKCNTRRSRGITERRTVTKCMDATYEYSKGDYICIACAQALQLMTTCSTAVEAAPPVVTRVIDVASVVHAARMVDAVAVLNESLPDMLPVLPASVSSNTECTLCGKLLPMHPHTTVDDSQYCSKQLCCHACETNKVVRELETKVVPGKRQCL